MVKKEPKCVMYVAFFQKTKCNSYPISTCHDILGRFINYDISGTNHSTSIFGYMVKFSHSVRLSDQHNSAVRFWPYGPFPVPGLASIKVINQVIILDFLKTLNLKINTTIHCFGEGPLKPKQPLIG